MAHTTVTVALSVVCIIRIEQSTRISVFHKLLHLGSLNGKITNQYLVPIVAQMSITHCCELSACQLALT